MKTLGMTLLILFVVQVAQPLAASEFVVVSATGALEPEGLQAGQELSAKTRLRLEPWGRVIIRETTECRLTHVVAGVRKYVLTPTKKCSAVDEPMEVAGRIQRGEVFSALLAETGSSLADQLVTTLKDDPCVFLPRVSEEGSGQRQCPSGYALRGLRCAGELCDDKDLLCCPYLGGAPDPSAHQTAAQWISEGPLNVMQSEMFLEGLACRGPYCDNVLPKPFESSRLVNTGACDWSVWSSERPGTWLDCQPGRLVAGIRCRERHCGEVGVYCCEAKVE